MLTNVHRQSLHPQRSLLFESEWRYGLAGGQVSAICKQGRAVTRQVLTHFGIGSRDVRINPRDARVGRNAYWPHDEWKIEKQIAKR